MAEQPSSSRSTSATDGDDVVKIPKSQYMQAVATIRQQRLQLVAASNLHRLMRDKEEELAASKEQVRQMQLNLEQSETRLDSMIRLQATVAAPSSIPAATHSLEEDGACPQSTEECFLPHSEGVAFRKYPECVLSQSDVEADGEVAVKLECCTLPSNMPVGKDTERPMKKPVILGSTVPTSVPSPSLLATSSFSASTDTCSAHVTCLTSSVTASPSLLPTVTSAPHSESKDLLDKVLQQNARLKKTLRDLLSQKGLSVSTYLVCHPAVVNYV